jgi:hypothetical protein
MVGREDDGVWITLKEEIHASPEEVASCIASALMVVASMPM